MQALASGYLDSRKVLTLVLRHVVSRFRLSGRPDETRQPYASLEREFARGFFEGGKFPARGMPEIDATHHVREFVQPPESCEFPAKSFTDGAENQGRCGAQ